MSKENVSAPDLLLKLERMARLLRAAGHAGGLNPVQWEALRYLARANRYSNSPIALAKYLDSTKGTVSQTIKSLERKGLIGKGPRAGEKRSISLTLTENGESALAGDPLTAFSKSLDDLGGKTRRRLAKGIGDVLDSETRRRKLQDFGTCASCRYFREKGGDPHACMLYEEPLTEREASLICVEYVAG
jgi:DNA-binding MarR family transcriptional regulator